MPRSLDDLIARSEHLADQFEAFEPGEASDAEPALMALRRAAHQQSLAERALLDAVTVARQSGTSWKRIGAELGTSGEAARQRYAERADGA